MGLYHLFLSLEDVPVRISKSKATVAIYQNDYRDKDEIELQVFYARLSAGYKNPVLQATHKTSLGVMVFKVVEVPPLN